MMKRIVAWVNKEEQKSLEIANKKNYPIIFAKNKKEFISLIDCNSFTIIAIQKARHINIIREIVRMFPKIRFYAMTRLDDKFTTPNEFSFIVDEQNVTSPNGDRSQYIASELISFFGEVYEE